MKKQALPFQNTRTTHNNEGVQHGYVIMECPYITKEIGNGVKLRKNGDYE